jgi:Fe2+ or Zn2+ uptake regulation protein
MASDGEFVSLLRDAFLRVTAPRVAMLAEMRNYAHADVVTLTAAVRRRLGTVSRQAVYDVLSVLTEAGLVSRIQPASSSVRFEVLPGCRQNRWLHH